MSSFSYFPNRLTGPKAVCVWGWTLHVIPVTIIFTSSQKASTLINTQIKLSTAEVSCSPTNKKWVQTTLSVRIPLKMEALPIHISVFMALRLFSLLSCKTLFLFCVIYVFAGSLDYIYNLCVCVWFVNACMLEYELMCNWLIWLYI